MSIFSKLGLVSEDELMQLENALGADVRAIHEFYRQYGLRLNELKKAMESWETGKDFTFYTEFSNNLLQKNKQLGEHIKKLLALGEKNELLVKIAVMKYKLADEIIKKGPERSYRIAISLTERADIEKLLKNLDSDLDNLEDNFLTLQSLIKEQAKYIKKHKLSPYERDYGLYRLLKDEVLNAREMMRSIVSILSESKQFVSSPARYLEKGKFGSLHMEEVLPYNLNRDFQLMYDSVYCKLIPDPDERESMEKFQDYMSIRTESHKERSMTHILMLKSGPVPVGGAVFDFIGPAKDICYVVVWYIFIEKEFRGKGLPLVNKKILQIAANDARHFGYNKLDGFFAEVENPEKLMLVLSSDIKERANELADIFKQFSRREINKIVKELEESKKKKTLRFEHFQDVLDLTKQALNQAAEEIKKMEYRVAVNPKARVRLYRQLKFRKVDIQYVQLPLKGGKAVYYLDLICLPLNPDWQQEFPSDSFEKIYRSFIEYGFEKDPDKEPICRKIIKEIRSKPTVKLLELQA